MILAAAVRVLITTVIAACLLGTTVRGLLPEIVEPDPATGISTSRTGVAVWVVSLAMGLAEGYRWWKRRQT